MNNTKRKKRRKMIPPHRTGTPDQMRRYNMQYAYLCNSDKVIEPKTWEELEKLETGSIVVYHVYRPHEIKYFALRKITHSGVEIGVILFEHLNADIRLKHTFELEQETCFDQNNTYFYVVRPDFLEAVTKQFNF